MSWTPVTHQVIQCDARDAYGQCEAVLSDPQWPTRIRTTHGEPIGVPTLFSGPQGDPLPAGIDFEMGLDWLVMPDRALCPDHVAAEEALLVAELDGLPFDEQDGGDSRG